MYKLVFEETEEPDSKLPISVGDRISKEIPTKNIFLLHWTSLVVQIVKNLLAMREIWVGSLGQEEPLEKGMTSSSIPVFLTVESHGKRSLVVYSSWACRVGHDCFIDYVKAFDCVYHNKLWKILKEIGIQDHLTYLLRNLYAGQETS